MLQEPRPTGGTKTGRLDLEPDCERCCGLCCVAPPFSASPDFAIDKSAGRPCPHLTGDFRCEIHHRLRPEGFPGCVAYDCFGAGQKVTQIIYQGDTWRRSPAVARQMFEVYSVMRHLHALLKYLSEAMELRPAGDLQDELRHAFDEVERLSLDGAEALAALDVAPLRQRVNELLVRVSDAVRTPA
jgi:hypothetical protein